MNRLSTAFATPVSSSPAKARVQRPLRGAARFDPPHCLLAPLHYERNYAYPLIVWLHGPEGDERELARIMPLVSLRNYVSLSVRGPVAEGCGYDWPQTPDAIAATELRIAAAVAIARQRFNVHEARVFLAGQESGGTMALRVAARQPDQYVGAASFGGPFPEGHAPLARLAQARGLRLLIAHPRDSISYPIEHVCQELALFHAAGMSVTLRQYPCADGLTTMMLHDLDVWLMEQVTGVGSADQSQSAPLPSEWN